MTKDDDNYDNDYNIDICGREHFIYVETSTNCTFIVKLAYMNIFDLIKSNSTHPPPSQPHVIRQLSLYINILIDILTFTAGRCHIHGAANFNVRLVTQVEEVIILVQVRETLTQTESRDKCQESPVQGISHML